MPKEEKKEFTFIKEQIKRKPFYKKKWFTRGLAGIGLAVIFGGVAGTSFAVVKPWAQKQFGEPNVVRPIIIEQEETEVSEEDFQETETETVRETESETSKSSEEAQTESQESPQVIEKKELELNDYKKLYNEMYMVAAEAAASIVTVIGQTSDVDWSNQVDESQIQVSGLVIAENGQNYYILTEASVVEAAASIIVTFSDGSTASAWLQRKDNVTGSAVITVPLTSVAEEVQESLKVAELGTSGTVRQGTPVISIGSPLYYSNSMAFGMITTVSKTSEVDSQYTMLTTDIIGSSQESGVLVDLNGNIIGIISRNFSQKNELNTVTALGISDMKYLLDMMSNNRDVPYIGIIGYEISEAISSENGVPQGIYVKEVEADSPAMYGGIQRGVDILTQIQGVDILTMNDYMQELRKYKPGQSINLKLKRRGIEGYVDFEVDVTLQGK